MEKLRGILGVSDDETNSRVTCQDNDERFDDRRQESLTRQTQYQYEPDDEQLSGASITEDGIASYVWTHDDWRVRMNNVPAPPPRRSWGREASGPTRARPARQQQKEETGRRDMRHSSSHNSIVYVDQLEREQVRRPQAEHQTEQRRLSGGLRNSASSAGLRGRSRIDPSLAQPASDQAHAGHTGGPATSSQPPSGYSTPSERHSFGTHAAAAEPPLAYTCTAVYAFLSTEQVERSEKALTPRGGTALSNPLFLPRESGGFQGTVATI